jgi:hypothetical protein
VDLTGDGLFTISNVKAFFELLWASLILLFFLPANLILMAIYEFAPRSVTFLELSPAYEYTMSWRTGIMSGLIWLIGYACIYLVLEGRKVRQREAEQARQEQERRRRYDDLLVINRSTSALMAEFQRDLLEPEETDEARLQRVSSWFETLATSDLLGDQFLPLKLPILGNEEGPELFYDRNEEELKSTPGYKKLVDECKKRRLKVRLEHDYDESFEEQIEGDMPSLAPTLYHVYAVVSRPLKTVE